MTVLAFVSEHTQCFCLSLRALYFTLVEMKVHKHIPHYSTGGVWQKIIQRSARESAQGTAQVFFLC